MAEELTITWDSATLQRRAAVHAIDWGVSLLFTMIFAAPAILEWEMPRHVIGIFIFPFHILWQSAWIISTGRSFGQRTLGIWIIDSAPEPFNTTARQRLLLIALKALAALPPLAFAAYPTMLLEVATRIDSRHFIERISQTRVCHPHVVDTNTPAPPEGNLTAHTEN